VPRLIRLGVSAGKAMNLILTLVLEVAFKCIGKLYISQFNFLTNLAENW
jgi:hypothetical protein